MSTVSKQTQNNKRVINDLEALHRARSRKPGPNDVVVVMEFSQRGIPASDIKPGVNVLTYRAWRALGRHVRRGEKSVRIPVWGAMDIDDKREPTGKRVVSVKRTACVFHVSQTDAIDKKNDITPDIELSDLVGITDSVVNAPDSQWIPIEGGA